MGISLLALAAPEVVNMTISGAAIDNKVATDTAAFFLLHIIGQCRVS